MGALRRPLLQFQQLQRARLVHPEALPCSHSLLQVVLLHERGLALPIYSPQRLRRAIIHVLAAGGWVGGWGGGGGCVRHAASPSPPACS